MKIAKVVSVRDVGPLKPPVAPCGDAGIADCLRRYPHIPDEDRRRLLRFVRRASREQIRDSVLRQGLEPRLIAFRKDHRRELRSGWSALAPWVFALLLVATLVQGLV